MPVPTDPLECEPVHARNFPQTPLSVEAVCAASWTLDDLWLPTVVARGSAIDHNLSRFAAWCDANDVEHAPHGKTTMAPQLWARQLAHGAWGLTAATVAQARLMDEHGIARVIIANEVTDAPQAAWLAEVAQRSDRTYLALVDSAAGLRLLDRAGAAAGSVVPVLVEIGVPGRRVGVRSVAAALDLARQVHQSEHVRLAGIEGYEGVLPQARDEAAVAAVSDWLSQLPELTRAADREGLFADVDDIIVTAGGSAFPDLAANALREVIDVSRPVRRIVRAGCVISHDHQSYERSSPLRSAATADPLVPALTAFARVSSTPEPGLALLAVGKRDVPVDVDLPIVLRVRRGDEAWRQLDGVTVTELNDHHLFAEDPHGALQVGDLVELGLSHPCTAFDKWRLIPVLDDDRVADAIVTIF
ncbi:D-serine deaminase-like pyridoxal phosphate-dependent protein [Kineosphaera limosa]|uniref:D-serine dehydratase-like domain-containing protein n=1 Tax=Kineosphaera limosa NBRC 100340 TaxID=1184609 RepID=K6XBE2_9MICO|nr:alanine racemase [Kineosphaera limosa]NYE01918.1 D-serine deaminase-like pyridoxal phosphate-dependent protein [Kineosphaera limosa]GAB96144.1 hypothetical protein KILIM_032_00290 [Kineosphaera limosa NBRC 100340]